MFHKTKIPNISTATKAKILKEVNKKAWQYFQTSVAKNEDQESRNMLVALDNL